MPGRDASNVDAFRDARFSDTRFSDTRFGDTRFGDTRFSDASGDSSQSDARTRDAFFDTTPLLDGFAGDASVVDYIRARPCASGLARTRGLLEWPSVDCGHISDVQLVALEDEQLVGVATEVRECDDRPARILAQYAVLGPRGVSSGEELVVGPARGPAHAATNGSDIGICSGEKIFILSNEEVRAESTLPPPSGCSGSVICTGIANDADGWVIHADTPDCAAPAQILRLDTNGVPRANAFSASTSMDSISTSPFGVEALGVPSAGNATYYAWPRANPAPESRVELFSQANARVSGIGPWPYSDGALALVFAFDEGFLLRAVDRDGNVLLERFRNSFRTTPVSVAVQPTTFGLAVAIGYEPQMVTRLFFLDERGDDIVEPFQLVNSGNARGRLVNDLAWTDVLFLHSPRGPNGDTSDETLALGWYCED